MNEHRPGEAADGPAQDEREELVLRRADTDSFDGVLAFANRAEDITGIRTGDHEQHPEDERKECDGEIVVDNHLPREGGHGEHSRYSCTDERVVLGDEAVDATEAARGDVRKVVVEQDD